MPEVAGDKQMVETQYLIPHKSDEIQQRISKVNNPKLIDSSDSEGF